jgi:Mg2+ and Co2+ transporter CorA
MTHSKELHKYIKRIIEQILAETNMETWKPHLEQFSKENDQIFDKVKETQTNALDVDEVRKEWMSIMNNTVNLNLNHSVIQKTESSSNHDLSVS